MLVFGYGSLVNSATHPHAPARPARLRGWRREWVHAAGRAAAILTALPDPEGEIDGLVLPVAAEHRPGLLAREAAYDRAMVRIDPATEVTVFTIPPGRHPLADRPQPILLSYLDVVVQGYLAVFGVAGLDRFFASTRGWQVPVLNDRARPRYPRHQRLSADETAATDAAVAALGVTLLADG